MQFEPTEHAHRRYNPLTAQWILVCPHRMLRPWSGELEAAQANDVPEFDAANPLCPGVTRPNGAQNPNYASTYVFDNDFPALKQDVPDPMASDDALFQIASAQGTCRVMCFHPKSNVSLPQLAENDIVKVIDEWIAQFNELAKSHKWIQIFENKGASMGCSNPHPHCQIWASCFLPSQAALKNKNLRDYYLQNGRPLLKDYVEKELQRKQRIVIENNDWIVLVPFWAAWPFETMLIARHNYKRISDILTEHRSSLAKIIKQLTIKYDNLFKCSFPYSMGWHGAPTGADDFKEDDHWTLHAIYYPPLLRSASVRKFMVGFEMFAETQRDLTAEQAAQRLRDVSGEVHYLQQQ